MQAVPSNLEEVLFTFLTAEMSCERSIFEILCACWRVGLQKKLKTGKCSHMEGVNNRDFMPV